MSYQPALPFPRVPIIVPGRAARGRPAHEFYASLALSERFTDSPVWLEIYRSAFPTMIAAASVKADGWAQRGGIDRVVILACGRTFTIDEKIRTSDWPDILLEQWSDLDRQVPGWVQKPLACDFIAYAFAPSRRCYFLPVPLLQRAWRRYGRDWIAIYGQRRAQNRGFTSVSVPVPIQILLDSMGKAMVVEGFLPTRSDVRHD